MEVGEEDIKVYFHIVYGGGRRRYGGTGRNSLIKNNKKTIASCTISLHPISAKKTKLSLKKIQNMCFRFSFPE